MRNFTTFTAVIAALYITAPAHAQGVISLGDMQAPETAAPVPVHAAPQAAMQLPASQPQGCVAKATSDGMTFSGSCAAEIAAYNAASRQQQVQSTATAKDCQLVWRQARNGYAWNEAVCSETDARAQLAALRAAGDERYERRVEFTRRQAEKSENSAFAREVLGAVVLGGIDRALYGRSGYGYRNSYSRGGYSGYTRPGSTYSGGGGGWVCQPGQYC